MERERRITLLEGAIEEIEESKNVHKSTEVREHYLNNATRFIQEVLEDLQTEERKLDEVRKRVIERVKTCSRILTCPYRSAYYYLNKDEQEGLSYEDIKPYLVPGGKKL